MVTLENRIKELSENKNVVKESLDERGKKRKTDDSASSELETNIEIKKPRKPLTNLKLMVGGLNSRTGGEQMTLTPQTDPKEEVNLVGGLIHGRVENN